MLLLTSPVALFFGRGDFLRAPCVRVLRSETDAANDERRAGAPGRLCVRAGLTYDDVVMEENPTMTEVLHRLPREAISQREFRYKRAFQASLQKHYLEPSEHVKPEQDKPYLQHLLAEVRHEEHERAQYDNAERK